MAGRRCQIVPDTAYNADCPDEPVARLVGLGPAPTDVCDQHAAAAARCGYTVHRAPGGPARTTDSTDLSNDTD